MEKANELKSLTYCIITNFIYTVWCKKRPEDLHALFMRAVEMNRCKCIYVMTKHLWICVGIFA